MKSFYTLALLIAATVVYASPVAKPVGKLVPKAELGGGRQYIYYVVPSAEDEEAY
ncbi:hypothetical protein GX50_00020 [[Emmonsia] crescens]|uniref:Uncharacterized protein n=2 Tax=[Emmonsia] crescens TaxID=73230 RepID=A0A0G2JA12_9EURO|nr:hypothetical protein EMCG_09160 [Emmonsia crescens UAMH 3008]PGH37037.1 hypothetical protein GX50_00020 [Emmonsia crescens]